MYLFRLIKFIRLQEYVAHETRRHAKLAKLLSCVFDACSTDNTSCLFIATSWRLRIEANKLQCSTGTERTMHMEIATIFGSVDLGITLDRISRGSMRANIRGL